MATFFFALAVASLIALPRNVWRVPTDIEDSAANNPSPWVGCIKQAQFHGTEFAASAPSPTLPRKRERE